MSRQKILADLSDEYIRRLSQRKDESWDSVRLLDEFYLLAEDRLDQDLAKRLFGLVVEFETRIDLDTAEDHDWDEGWSTEQSYWRGLSKRFLKFCSGRLNNE